MSVIISDWQTIRRRPKDRTYLNLSQVLGFVHFVFSFEFVNCLFCLLQFLVFFPPPRFPDVPLLLVCFPTSVITLSCPACVFVYLNPVLLSTTLSWFLFKQALLCWPAALSFCSRPFRGCLTCFWLNPVRLIVLCRILCFGTLVLISWHQKHFCFWALPDYTAHWMFPSCSARLFYLLL